MLLLIKGWGYDVLKIIQDYLTKIENLVCSIGLFVSTFLVFAQVINRYWLHIEIMWLGDMALYIFVTTYILAIAFSASHKGHIAVEMLQVKYLSGKPYGKAVYTLIMDILSFVIVLIFSIPTYRFFLRSIKYPEYGTLVRWFNTSWLIYVLFAVVVLCGI
nr:TRAP transporter small permease subunit [Synergistales bacterium]